ncbi:MAG: spermidine/putrescine ABC transporter substrate-binding protein [Verrucomicrobia bacterium]|nr:MAG: spermidine/putrescine ABC transporter substrate-binding protein [Verrucomicrobiota bacterium]
MLTDPFKSTRRPSLMPWRNIALIATALASFAAPSIAKAEEKPVLTIFNWSEYIDPEVYRQFEKEFNCIVKETNFETPEEALNKMVAGGSRTFDICAVGGGFKMQAGIAMDVLKKLDHSKIPNIKNLGPLFQNPAYDPGNSYSIPYQWGTTGVLIRKELLPAEGFSMSAFFDEKKQLGRFVLIDSTIEMIGYAHLYHGKSVNSVELPDLKKAIDLLTVAKGSKNFMGFDGGVGGRSKVVAGTADYAIVYNGDANRVLNENPGKFAYVIPKEGAPLWIDQLCIAKDAPNPELAYAFLNYVLDPKIGAQISAWTKYATPNQAAKPFLPAEDLASLAIYPDEETEKRLQLLEGVGEKETLRTEAWTAIKAD